MINELTFLTTVLFIKVTFDKDADCWQFLFNGKIHASSSGFWRLLEHNKIAYVSLDNDQQFGLPKRIDLVEEVNKKLTGTKLLKIEVIKDTFDLKLTLTEDLSIEIFVSSSGYETYEFSIEDKRYIGLGSGEIAIFDNY